MVPLLLIVSAVLLMKLIRHNKIMSMHRHGVQYVVMGLYQPAEEKNVMMFYKCKIWKVEMDVQTLV